MLLAFEGRAGQPSEVFKNKTLEELEISQHDDKEMSDYIFVEENDSSGNDTVNDRNTKSRLKMLIQKVL